MILSFRVFNKRLNMRADPFFDNRFFSESETPPFVYFADDCFVFVLSFPKRPSNDAPVKILSVEKSGSFRAFRRCFRGFWQKKEILDKNMLEKRDGVRYNKSNKCFF